MTDLTLGTLSDTSGIAEIEGLVKHKKKNRLRIPIAARKQSYCKERKEY